MKRIAKFRILLLCGVLNITFISPIISQTWGNNDERLIPIANTLVNGELVESPYVHTIIEDNYLYYTDYYGFFVFDISNPESPIRIGGTSLPGKATYFDIRDNYAYVCGEFGIVIVDISIPSNPEAVNYVFLDFRPYQVVIDSSIMYIAGVENLNSFSLADPLSPESLCLIYIPPSNVTFAGIIKYDNYIYYSNQLFMYAINVENPSNMQSVFTTEFNTSGSCWGPMAIKDNYLIVPTTLKLLVYNLENPASPTLVYSNLPTNHTIYDIVVDGNIMVLNHRSNNGLWTILDITNPSNPIVVHENSTIPTYYSYSLGVINNNILYLLDNGQEGLEGYTIDLIDLSIVTNPVLVGEIKSFPGKSRSVSIFEKNNSRYALVAQDNQGPEFETGILRVMDITDESNPILVSSLDLPNLAVSVIAISDKYAFATIAEFHMTMIPYYEYKLALIDIHDIQNPYLVEIYEYGTSLGYFFNSNMAYYNGYLYAVSKDHLKIFKESSGAIEFVSSTSIFGNHGTSIYANTPGYVYIGGGNYGFQLYNVENPEMPYMVNYFDSPGTCYDVYADNGIAYTANWDGGIYIYDVSQNIVIPMSQMNIDGYANSIVEENGIAYVGLFDGRIQMIDVSDPEDPKNMGWYLTSGTRINDMIIDTQGNDGFLYVANELTVSTFKIETGVGIHENDNIVKRNIFCSVYPNPIDNVGVLKLTINNDSYVTINLFDALGCQVMKVFSGDLNSGNNQIPINVKDLNEGLYFIEITTNMKNMSQKIVVQH